jgi:hypothetical protein
MYEEENLLNDQNYNLCKNPTGYEIVFHLKFTLRIMLDKLYRHAFILPNATHPDVVSIALFGFFLSQY